jgi:hypothetical protein
VDKLIEVLKQNPELALALAMVLQTERDDVWKAYQDVLPESGVVYDLHAIFPKQYRTLIESLKSIAVEGIAKRKRNVVHKQEL